MASLATAGSRPMPGGNERPDGVANQNACEKNARQQSWCRQLHEMDSLLDVMMDKLTNGLRAPKFPTSGNCFLPNQ